MTDRSGALVLVACLGAGFLVGCSGASDAPKPSAAEPPPPVATDAVAAPAPPSAGASASAPTASTSASAPPAEPAKPSSQGKCPAGMAEFSGGKFKSSYYRAELSVAPFCLDMNLATTDEYKACVESGKCDKSAVHACDPSTWNIEGRGNLPMICVDFMQAERYCKAQGKRIVSDLEWEWAARVGDEARAYPWGSEAPGEQLCWSGKEKRTTPCPVGTYAQGPAGVFDLVGNIYQWTTTTNDSTGSYRVGRGGSWKDTKPEQVAVTNRGGFKNTYRCGFLGIRCSAPVP
jgi:sulfatase modifying factor 1